MTLAGVVSVVVGVWLPWLIFRPGYTGPARRLHLYISGMHYGIQGMGWWVLGSGALGVGNAVALSGRRDRAAGVARGSAGVGVVLLALLYIVDGMGCLYVPDIAGLGYTTGCIYVHGPGVFLTAFGGVLLALAGGYQFVTAASGRPGELGQGATAR